MDCPRSFLSVFLFLSVNVVLQEDDVLGENGINSS